MTEKDVEFDIDLAKKVGKTVEFIATFGTILVIHWFFKAFLISLLSGIIAYAIVNGVLFINLKGLKEKLKNLKN